MRIDGRCFRSNALLVRRSDYAKTLQRKKTYWILFVFIKYCEDADTLSVLAWVLTALTNDHNCNRHET